MCSSIGLYITASDLTDGHFYWYPNDAYIGVYIVFKTHDTYISAD